MSGETAGYFEDLVTGETVDCGSIEVTEAEMLEFARRYDPQPIHLESEAASATRFGDIIASGWLTCSLSARLLVDGYLNERKMLGASGIDELRWHRPVYAGDTLSVTVELVDKDPGDDSERGWVSVQITTTNQDGDVVLTMLGRGIAKKRPSGIE